ncbi:hypothetical protein ROHU_005854 [Labeo rohita]|uniref:Ig-like domain-containing protein n=1 Tax=Labeo rohita TaxID=84645 RepID=A0A498NAA8_LABRO|nr:hypothetical protein ROHU_005854 [Labeo rohita]
MAHLPDVSEGGDKMSTELSSLSVAVKMLHESQNTDEQKTRHSCHDLKQHHTLLQWRDCCLDRFCRFNQFDPCYAALGHKLNVLMVLDTNEYDMKIQKRINYNKITDPVCRVKNDRIKKNECDLYSNRSEVTVINGTLIMNRVIRADSGNYTVSLYRSDGSKTSTDLEVNVEAPIGSVEVSIICSSSGVMRASCSSEGDQLLYSWTLNGDSLMDGNGSIDLNEGTDGNITCSVKNHVSHGQKTINVKPCVGLDQFCRFNQSDPCYAALGHKLNVLMVLDTSGYDMKIQKRINYNKTTDPVCRVKNDTIKKKECDLYSNRPEVTVINGTLIINRVIRADSGNYTVTLYRSDGTDTSTHLEVNVEAPIGSVEVSIICSSSGVMRASCSSEGDQLLYSWTLNGDSLMDGNSSIDLNEGTDGNITCSVKNHVSHRQKTINVKPCPVSVVFVLVWCFQMMGLFGLLGGFHIYMRHTSVSVVFVLVWCFQLMGLFGLLGGFHIYMRHTSGLDRFCRLNQSYPCYAALGHKLNVLMLLNTSEYDMKIQKRINYNKETDPVCRVKNDTIKRKECDLYSNRPEVTVINGTLIINRVIRADSGNYTVFLYHSDGTDTSADLEDLEVNVEAPIGSVEVSIICSSSGVMRASCSSEGDQLLYNWTLNGDSLTDGNSSIDLNEGTDGNITCSVKNHVSHGQKTINVKPCPVSVVFVLVWCFQLMGLFGLLGGFHIYMRHTSAPIGSVEVSIICSSSGVMRASCSSEGDQLLYSWTLNGDSLMDGNSSIDLNEGTDGNITCSVKNHVSHGQKTINVKSCPGPTTASATTQDSEHGMSFSKAALHISLIVLGCIALILILLFITVCHIYKKKQVKSTPATAGNTEIIYADISHEKTSKKRQTEALPDADVEYSALKPQKKRKEKKQEEVQYGEVRFIQNRSNAHQRPQEECVYSQSVSCNTCV